MPIRTIQVRVDVGGKHMGQDWINTHMFTGQTGATPEEYVRFLTNTFVGNCRNAYLSVLHLTSSIDFWRGTILNAPPTGRITYTVADASFGLVDHTLVAPNQAVLFRRSGVVGSELPLPSFRRSIRSRIFLPAVYVECLVDGHLDLSNGFYDSVAFLGQQLELGFRSVIGPAQPGEFVDTATAGIVLWRRARNTFDVLPNQTVQYVGKESLKLTTINSRAIGHGR